jgi:Domain of Unknown Function (DUF928)
MSQFIQILIQPWNYKLWLGCALGCSILLAPAAMAIKAKKPARATAPTHTTGGGVRGGCSGNDPVGLTALAPIGHVGQTTSTRPTLTWFSPNPALPTKVMLHRLGDPSETAISTQGLIVDRDRPGIMQLKVPQDLKVNQVYAWRVVVDCPSKDGAYNTSQLVAIAEIEVVKPTAYLQTRLDKTNGLKKAELYAEEGFWYDTWAETLGLAPKATAKETTESLLNDLIEMERSTLQNLAEKAVNCVENPLEGICQQQTDVHQQIDHLSAMLKVK